MAYSQKDPRWANVNLGKSGYSIGGYGCMLIAFCNVAEQYGKSVNPLQMNQLLMNKGVAVDWLGGADLSKVYPDIQYRGFVSYPNNINIDQLSIQNQPGVEGIVKLDYNPSQSGVQTHFSRLRGTSGGYVVIDDSLDGARVVVKDRYGDQNKAVHGVDLFYKAPAAPVTPINVTEEKIMTSAEETNAYRIVLQRQPEAGAVLGKRTGYQFITSAENELKAQRNAINAQIANLQTTLANEQAKPPKEVIKEVQVIVEKIVEIEKPVEVIKEVEPSWLKTVREAILTFLRIKK